MKRMISEMIIKKKSLTCLELYFILNILDLYIYLCTKLKKKYESAITKILFILTKYKEKKRNLSFVLFCFILFCFVCSFCCGCCFLGGGWDI